MPGAEMNAIDYLFQAFVTIAGGIAGWGIGQTWRFMDFRKELIRAAETGLQIEIEGRLFVVSEVKKGEYK